MRSFAAASTPCVERPARKDESATLGLSAADGAAKLVRARGRLAAALDAGALVCMNCWNSVSNADDAFGTLLLLELLVLLSWLPVEPFGIVLLVDADDVIPVS